MPGRGKSGFLGRAFTGSDMEQARQSALKRVLIIDDDARLNVSIQDFLQSHGYETRSLVDGASVFDETCRYDPHIILLDVVLPGEDGFSILRNLRTFSKVPVIMLTARGEDTDRIVGLELGADDYLPKPFNPRELLARIRAVLRRARQTPDPHEGVENSQSAAPLAAFSADTLYLDEFILDARRQRLMRGDKSQKLSTAEFSILFTLMSHAGQVLTREQLLALAFSRDDYASDRNIDVYISRIRVMLRKMGEMETRVRTVWGTGYSWVKEQ